MGKNFNKKKEVKADLNKYFCSKHGGEGEPSCSECWEKLRQFAKDNNAYLTGENEKTINEL